jgi:DNA-binding transcriptional LysR family regulator
MTWTTRLRLRHLQLLIRLAETGSISDAARTAHTTQPGLSKWLKDLEEDAGATLFERHARGLRPTAQGELLINHVRRILSEMERAQSNMDALKEGNAPSISIGTSPASAPSLVPDAIGYFLAMHPRAHVSLQENTMNVLLERLELGQLDMVIGRLDNYRPRSTLHSQMLFREPMQVIARIGHPLAMRSHLDWSDLSAFDWILWPEGTPIRQRLDTALSNAGLKPLPSRIESSSLMANLRLLQTSDMLSVASGRVAEHFTRSGLISTLDFEMEAEGYIGICWRDEPYVDSTVLDFRECLIKASHP